MMKFSWGVSLHMLLGGSLQKFIEVSLRPYLRVSHVLLHELLEPSQCNSSLRVSFARVPWGFRCTNFFYGFLARVTLVDWFQGRAQQLLWSPQGVGWYYQNARPKAWRLPWCPMKIYQKWPSYSYHPKMRWLVLESCFINLWECSCVFWCPAPMTQRIVLHKDLSSIYLFEQLFFWFNPKFTIKHSPENSAILLWKKGLKNHIPFPENIQK